MTPTNAVAAPDTDTDTDTAAASRRRRGFTLVELLVVMALIAALAALALMLLPSIANSDMALKGAGEVQATLKISQGMAAAAKLPRGVRFLPGANPLICTELQYLESPPVMVADPNVMVGNPPSNSDNFRPHVQVRYDLNPDGSVNTRHCIIYGLTPEQSVQVGDGAILVLQTLGAWSRINGPATPVAATAQLPAGLEVTLEVYPDAFLGGATWYRTYHFGVYGPPWPLLAEPTIPLPKNIGVDLSLSYPLGRPNSYYDIMFAPSGQTITSTAITGNTNIFLWVRDFTKGNPPGDMAPLTMPTPTSPPGTVWTFDMNKFRRGGEQQIVGIRNGFIGTAPVLWPNATGDYGTPTPTGDPYSLARQRLN